MTISVAKGAAPIATTVRAPRLQDQLCFALYSTSHAFSRRYKPLLDRLGLTYPQYLCMMVLWERDDITVTAIGTRLHLDSGTLTPLLKRLETAGLVERRRDRIDERRVKILLTPAGRAMAGQANDVGETIVCSTGQTSEEAFRLLTEILRLRKALVDGLGAGH